MELPGVWFSQTGQLARGYDASELFAYSGWQVERFVTVIEVEGGVAQALPFSRLLKEAVSESYQP